ncbi:RNA polymerase subunit sigma-70 [uncultured Mycolicibacterium sp.]|uniref:RNA polymerase subunit sigma-70 n=1 Tax=uncultured Mycolicibacterium sp. TaxID=2320817 RepID=UPI00263A1B1E|nr:RNA polymerase subunit sigma-70 [uncultured Mycolicibacterium sp.]
MGERTAEPATGAVAGRVRRATLIGVVTGIGRGTDRAAACRLLSGALSAVAGTAVEPPAFTVGAEFRGSYPTVGAAIDAALRLRLTVTAVADIRFGIGWGEVGPPGPGGLGGPGWWAARRAVDETAATAQRPGFTHVRTTFAADGRCDVETVNAALMCRDYMLGTLDARSVRILRGLLNDRTKRDIAAAEGISPSAVSQRATRDGLDLLVTVIRRLREVP